MRSLSSTLIPVADLLITNPKAKFMGISRRITKLCESFFPSQAVLLEKDRCLLLGEVAEVCCSFKRRGHDFGSPVIVLTPLAYTFGSTESRNCG